MSVFEKIVIFLGILFLTWAFSNEHDARKREQQNFTRYEESYAHEISEAHRLNGQLANENTRLRDQADELKKLYQPCPLFKRITRPCVVASGLVLQK